jgi:hypothetical protein
MSIFSAEPLARAARSTIQTRTPTNWFPQLGQLAAFLQQRIRHAYRRQPTAPLPSRTAENRYQLQLRVGGVHVAHLATLNDSVLSAQVSSRCLVDDWFHAAQRRHKIMTITRGIAVVATFAGVAVGAARPAWADQTMSGHDIETVTDPSSGQSITNDWYFTPCGDGCASVVSNGSPLGQTRLVNGRWVMDVDGYPAGCADGSTVPNAAAAHFTWDPNTLAGTQQITDKVPVCGNPAGFTLTNNFQLRQA